MPDSLYTIKTKLLELELSKHFILKLIEEEQG